MGNLIHKKLFNYDIITELENSLNSCYQSINTIYIYDKSDNLLISLTLHTIDKVFYIFDHVKKIDAISYQLYNVYTNETLTKFYDFIKFKYNLT